MRNKILRPANAKYHYSYLFFYKINKGDLRLMYSCVFWCKFIDIVGFFGYYCLTPLTLLSRGLPDLHRVCLNVAGRDSRVEVTCAGAGKGRGCGCGLGSRVNINHQV